MARLGAWRAYGTVFYFLITARNRGVGYEKSASTGIGASAAVHRGQTLAAPADVYKRQQIFTHADLRRIYIVEGLQDDGVAPPDEFFQRSLTLSENNDTQISVPVSYTHLDVYKRQASASAV